jgi:hypothetical protein
VAIHVWRISHVRRGAHVRRSGVVEVLLPARWRHGWLPMGHRGQMVVHLDKARSEVLPLCFGHTRCLNGSHAQRKNREDQAIERET